MSLIQFKFLDMNGTSNMEHETNILARYKHIILALVVFNMYFRKYEKFSIFYHFTTLRWNRPLKILLHGRHAKCLFLHSQNHVGPMNLAIRMSAVKATEAIVLTMSSRNILCSAPEMKSMHKIPQICPKYPNPHAHIHWSPNDTQLFCQHLEITLLSCMLL